MTRDAPKPGDTLTRSEHCSTCGQWTNQYCEVLEPVEGTRLCSTEWKCYSCEGWAA